MGINKRDINANFGDPNSLDCDLGNQKLDKNGNFLLVTQKRLDVAKAEFWAQNGYRITDI